MEGRVTVSHHASRFDEGGGGGPLVRTDQLGASLRLAALRVFSLSLAFVLFHRFASEPAMMNA